MNWQYLIIHHTGAEEKDAEQVRRYHKSLGWRDTGYNFVIERNGLVVPGRSLDQPGAHCRAAGMNTKGIGIALIGNLEEHPPRPEQVYALVELLAQLMEEYHIPAQNVLGHREVPGAATACPGRYFPLAEVREKVRERPAQTVTQDGDSNRQARPAPASPGNAAGETTTGLDQVPLQNKRNAAEMPVATDRAPAQNHNNASTVPAGPDQAPPQNQHKAAKMPADPDQLLPRAEHDYGKEKTGTGLWIVQAGAFSTRERAEDYARELRERGVDAFVKRDGEE
ncbi:N-acetylmuramoyl-L-alanine amidase [Desulfallas sp. Bu1-1]|uniref:N-acetylmuramoyl-L-alanine amidase n=1 Tax=Desulfallas sp. Bu1-1 TaxID=2787620 RepID=UPI00189DDE5F|nr:N-acetylmuramoyl-L-alanine amidase [Desulfallas sp. Bu1-1]MBF7081692.1 N-acetylmuramoyl-L-alanine amidase [Desulfallas sp. Bu1-1]